MNKGLQDQRFITIKGKDVLFAAVFTLFLERGGPPRG
jgi:hypothetical protein